MALHKKILAGAAVLIQELTIHSPSIMGSGHVPEGDAVRMRKVPVVAPFP